MIQFIDAIKTIPTHVWLLVSFLALLIFYYIRPDPVTIDLVKGFSGALLLSLRTGTDQRPPAPSEAKP
jgi:hypothetical protein